jgi:DNA-binding response OmpR family regulator
MSSLPRRGIQSENPSRSLRPGKSRSTNLTPLPDPSTDPEAGQSIPAHRAVILCVERDPHVRDLETYFLTEAGFEVTFAADGIEALELARTLRPDIVITEILVPKLDGLALCRRLKTDETTKGTSVLVFSLLAAEERARDAGADAFLGKPLAAQRLTDAVRRLLVPGKPSAPADDALLSIPDGTP